jgi:small subunit ribosomal protein S17
MACIVPGLGSIAAGSVRRACPRKTSFHGNQVAMPRRVMIGKVTSDKMLKTRRVEVPRLVRHPKYGKIIRRSTICYVHDENNQSRLGDTVEIIESRPLSKLKRWELVRIVTRGADVQSADLPEQDVAAGGQGG